MIDEARTLELFGYTSDELTPQSSKPIVAVCDECGKYRILRVYRYKNLCASCNRKGDKHPMYGKTLTDEHKLKMSIAHKGKKHPNKHHDLTDVTKHKLSEINKGKTLTEDHKRKLSAANQRISYDEWEGFAKEHLYCPKFNDACRESNRDKYDRRCFLSDVTEDENCQKLSVHHIDMNKAQGCDGHTWKLVPLSKKWHARSHSQIWEARITYLLENVWGR